MGPSTQIRNLQLPRKTSLEIPQGSKTEFNHIFSIKPSKGMISANLIDNLFSFSLGTLHPILHRYATTDRGRETAFVKGR